VSDLDRELPVFNVRTLSEHVDTNLVFRRVPAQMFMVLGPLLLALAAVGIYAVVAYTVSLRTAEIGVRVALGATPGQVVSRIVREGLRAIGVGAGAGWLVAVVAARHIVPADAADPLFLVAVPVVLLGVASMACWLPARRAARVDPMAALRDVRTPGTGSSLPRARPRSSAAGHAAAHRVAIDAARVAHGAHAERDLGASQSRVGER
jgi:ABC-type antimicrobial peptide transport system permease subunit